MVCNLNSIFPGMLVLDSPDVQRTAVTSPILTLPGPLTTARAYIQSILDKELYFPVEKLHRATCACRKE